MLPPVEDAAVDRGQLRIFDSEGTLYESTFTLPDEAGAIQLSPPAIAAL